MTWTMTSSSKHWAAPLASMMEAGLLVVCAVGCASVDTANTDSRAWGRPSEFEQRERCRGALGFSVLPFPQEGWEQQRNEEWLNRH